jgi:hypothetical protein
VDECLWFEVRPTNTSAPEGWGIYSANLDGNEIEYFCPGANPCVFDGVLYFGIWNGQTFDFARTR